MAIGLEIVWSPIKRAQVLERAYPRLGDIATFNEFGSERLRKTALAQWELYYSQESAP